MKELRKEEMLKVKGGFSSALLNAFMRTVSVMFNLGQAVGSSIRRVVNGKMCWFQNLIIIFLEKKSSVLINFSSFLLHLKNISWYNLFMLKWLRW